MSKEIRPATELTTLDGILGASYGYISGEKGQERDWDAFRSLFSPEARLMPIVSVPGKAPHVRMLSADDYIKRVEPIFAAEAFWERESSREVNQFGRMAHVLSHYEALRTADGEPFERGTNSMQLFWDDSRWWIISIMWNTSRSN